MADLLGTFASATAITATFGVWALGVASVRLWDRTELTRALIGHKMRARRCAQRAKQAESTPHERRWTVDEPTRSTDGQFHADRVPSRTEIIPLPSVAGSGPESVSRGRRPASVTPPPIPDAPQDLQVFQAESTPLRAPRTVLLMGATEQVSEFVAYCRAERLGKNCDSGRWERCGSHEQWFSDYAAWAQARSILRLPESVFLKTFSKTAGVEKSRGARQRCPQTGEIVRTAKGSPVRPIFYTLTEVPLSDAKPVSRRNSAAVRSGRAKVQAGDMARQAALLAQDRAPLGTWADEMHEITRRLQAAA